MTPFAHAHADLTPLGYHVLPLIAASATHPGHGKAPGNYRGGWQGMTDWQKYRDETPGAFHLKTWMNAPDANAGIVCGTAIGRDHHVVVLDFDAEDADVLDTLLRAAPASPMVKRGQKGESRFYKAAKTIKTRSYDGPDGRMLDVLTGFAARQTVVPPSIHPKTLQPYVWTHGPVAAADLPELTGEDMEALEEALEQCGWSREGRADLRPARPVPASIDSNDPFELAKTTALANLTAWVPALDLYNCRRARGGYEAVATWRASSGGQRLEDRKRNLSIQSSGIKDWGDQRGYSAIDLVMEALDLSEGAALEWLEERLGLSAPDVVIDLRRAADLPEPLRNPGPATRNSPVVSNTAVKAPEVVISGESAEFPDALTRVPGLVGELTDWISDSARKPQRAGALLAALELVGTAAGRQYAGPTMTGTHLYGLFLAPSGAAKDHPLKCIGRVLHACTMGQHFGPSGFMSMSALINRITRQPLTLTCIDEFGSFLGRINGRKASTHEKAITGVLRTAWGSSFDTMAPPEWAGRVGEPIHSPALSIYGVSTQEEFFQNLEGGDVFNGFLNRFLILSTQVRVTEREPTADKMVVPESIVTGMAAVYGGGNPLTRATSHSFMSDAPTVVVPWADEWAHKAYRALGEMVERMEHDAVFFTRTAEMAQRLAVIRAIGVDPVAPKVTLADMDWGREVALWSARRMVADARDYMSETQVQAEAQLVVRAVRAGRGWTSYRDVARKLNNRMKATELRDILDGLVESGTIEMEARQPPSGGHKVKWYRMGA